MGTDAKELQKQLIQLSESLGWSNNQLSKEIYHELYDDDDPQELRRFCERFKKGLQRESFTPERLNTFLEAIYRTPDFVKQKQVKPVVQNWKSFSVQGERRLKKLSERIVKDIEENLSESL